MMNTLQDMALQVEVWSRDPWQWVRDCVVTVDEAREGAVNPLPDKLYLKYVTQVWQKESILAIPKSRRMMATWLMLALHLHKAIFFPRSAIFIQSKKEEDSDFLIGPNRIKFMYDNLPKEYPWPKMSYKYCNLKFSHGSYVKGIAQGPDQLRQYTATAVLCDEVAFWEKADDTWAGLKPTIQGGGRVTLLSTASQGFFHRLVEGRLKDERRTS